MAGPSPLSSHELAGAVAELADVLIIGAGPAGLAAATYLGRFRRRVIIVDANDSRAKLIRKTYNCPGFPAGISGPDLLQRLRIQAGNYGALFWRGGAEHLRSGQDGFQLQTTVGTVHARRVILATGIVDLTPEIPRLRQAVARGVVRLCPICDGFEVINKRVAVVGPEERAITEALFLRDYTPYVAMLCNDPDEISRAGRLKAAAAGIEILDTVRDIEPGSCDLRVSLKDGSSVDYDVLYPAMGCEARSELAARLGADCDAEGYVVADLHQRTSVDGFYAIGDVAKALNQIAVAFGQAALAAADIHKWLRDNPAAQH